MRPKLFALGLVAGTAGLALAQAAPPATPQAAPATPVTSTAAPTAAPDPQKYIAPAGTKVLLSMKSAINTKTAKPGDPVYLVSNFPVIVDSHVLIPDGAYVQGVIDRVRRAGRVKGRAELTMHFTNIIFPNGRVVQIPGTVDSLPGSTGPKVTGNEGQVEQSSNVGHDVGTVAKGAGIGATAGSIAGAAGGTGAISGLGYGAAAGAAAGYLYTLFTRGDDIVIPAGSSVEMVLQRPLELEAQQFTTVDEPRRTEQQFVPVNQPQPLQKPKHQ
jgi:hypothetical protein